MVLRFRVLRVRDFMSPWRPLKTPGGGLKRGVVDSLGPSSRQAPGFRVEGLWCRVWGSASLQGSPEGCGSLAICTFFFFLLP